MKEQLPGYDVISFSSLGHVQKTSPIQILHALNYSMFNNELN